MCPETNIKNITPTNVVEMFQNPNTSPPPKTDCVSCGAPSKWSCQGCGQWYCQNCAPHGLCPTHFSTLDYEDQEAVKRVLKMMRPSIKTKITIFMAIGIPMIVLVISVIIFPTLTDLFWVPVIGIVVLIIPIIIIVFLSPLRKDLPRLKAMAQKYDFPGKPGAPPSSYGTTREYEPLPSYSNRSNAIPTRPMSNLELMRKKFAQKEPNNSYGSEPTPSAGRTPRMAIMIMVIVVFVFIGLIISFDFFS